jgi:hypothetical protein
VHPRAGQAGGHLLGAGRVDVGDRHHGSAGQHAGDPADVVLAHHAHADDAYVHAHYWSPPMPTLRR